MVTAAAMSVKSPEAFRTISEVASMLDVPQHVLRFWETRFSHIKPIKRAGGRRFYRPEDVDLLRGVRLLLYFEGYTIRGVQKILREKGARFVTELGRNDAKEQGARIVQIEEPEMSVVIPDMRGFDALATLARVHDDAAEFLALDETHREYLELLLTDLLALKSRLIAARGRVVV